VIYLDDMTYGLRHWGILVAGVGSGVSVGTTYVHMGSQSLALKAAGVSGATAAIYKPFAYPHLSKIGAEIAFALDSLQDAFRLSLEVYTGTQRYWYEMKYDVTNTRLQCRTGATSWQTVDSDLKLMTDPRLFHYMKLVVDIENGAYVRGLVDSTEYDLSDVSVYSLSSSQYAQVKVTITSDGDGVNESTCYVDCFILTQDEP